MSSKVWRGDAPAVSQVNTITVGGTAAAGQQYAVTINGKSVPYSASNTDTNSTIAAALQALLAACTIPEFQEVTWTAVNAVITGTAANPGVPFTQTSSATGTGTLTTQAGVAAPTISSTSTATSGGSLSDTTTYYYKITALNACGETTASGEVSRTTGNSGSNVNTITLNWSAPAGAGITGYNIYGRASSNGEAYIATVGAGTTSYVDTGSISPSGSPPTLNTTLNSGPNDWSVPSNWGGALPAASDTLTLQNSAVGLLYNGNGASSVALTSLTLDSTFTGAVGLPPFNPRGYKEYRPTYWTMASSTLTLLAGNGQSSGMVQIDGGSTGCTILVQQTASPAPAAVQGRPAFAWRGSGSSTLEVVKGSVGIAIEPGDTATLTSVQTAYKSNPQTDVNLTLGSGVTLTTVQAYGGQVTVQSNVTSLTVRNGATVTVLGAAAVATLDVENGEVDWLSSGNVSSTATVGPRGVLDFSRDARPKTVAAATVYGTLRDPLQVVTYTAAPLFPNGLGGKSGATLDWGSPFHLQRS